MLEPYRIDDFFNLDAGTSGQDDPLFSLFLDDDFSKLPPSYDFSAPASSPAASSASSSHSPFPMFAIDPQLVGTPATSKASSDFDEDDPESDDELPPTPKPKPNRKGTVMSGGIKKAPLLEKENKEGKLRNDPSPLRILEPEDWRPSPEEYKRMSSKEKRQLRNKISARNFRVRRKEYISTLEGDIAERDRLIDAIRSELGSSRSENIALRQEISALKKCLLEGRSLPDLPPPADLRPVSASPPPIPAPAAPAATTSPVVIPNTQKDLPTSPRLSNRAFWGGLGGMGVTPVHTTFVPPIAVLASKSSPTPLSPILKPSIFYEETIRPRVLQENLNPGLNPTAFRGLVEKKGAANINPALSGLNSLGHGIGAFDTFSDINPFTFKTLDAYRMQLWGKMAAQQHAPQPQPQPQQVTQPLGLAGNLRPHFFSSASRAKPAYPTSPPSPKLPSKEQAAAAAIASQTLFSKLGSAFWDAFSGSSSHTSATKQWDAEKVRKVLEGRAVVKVVDIDVPVPPRVPSPKYSVSSTSSHMSSSTKVDSPSCKDCLTDILEESMRGLTLNKK